MSRIFINKEKFTQECNKRIEAALEIAGIGENLIFLDWLVDDGK